MRLHDSIPKAQHQSFMLRWCCESVTLLAVRDAPEEEVKRPLEILFRAGH